MSLRSSLLALVSMLRFLVSVAAYAVAAGFLALFAFEFVRAPRLANSALMIQIERHFAPALSMVSSWFGWHWPRAESPNFAPLMLATVALLARAFVDSSLMRVDFRIRRMLRAPVRVRSAVENATAVVERYQLSAGSEQERAVLLKRYREIEDALKSASRKTCSFLSIDVVGSTKMKMGERKTAIDATFQAYEELVKETFESYGVWKETWTPDGVMACFLDRNLAVSAAREILSALERFNRNQNQLRTPIKIRCGVNEGEVTIFEDSALEKLADHSIDVAGHMQKYADEDALQLSAELFAQLENRDGFAATGRDVDGYETYEWKPPVGADKVTASPA